jgi:hypothetical protein
MLSVIIAGINHEKWMDCWNSINQAFSKKWEVIFVGPESPYQEVLDKGNVTYIKDFGCPSRCMQLGLLAAKEDWVMFSWDNGAFDPNVLDHTFNILETNGMDKNIAVSCKYIEGELPISQTYMASEIYYHINHHAAAYTHNIPDTYLLFNIGVIARETILKYGGLDCSFEAPSMALVDLAIRLQKSGVKIILQEEVVFRENWSKGAEGSHGPIHYAMVEHDMPWYATLWRTELWRDRLIIPSDNWKKASDKWERRFK